MCNVFLNLTWNDLFYSLNIFFASLGFVAARIDAPLNHEKKTNHMGYIKKFSKIDSILDASKRPDTIFVYLRTVQNLKFGQPVK